MNTIIFGVTCFICIVSVFFLGLAYGFFKASNKFEAWYKANGMQPMPFEIYKSICKEN